MTYLSKCSGCVFGLLRVLVRLCRRLGSLCGVIVVILFFVFFAGPSVAWYWGLGWPGLGGRSSFAFRVVVVYLDGVHEAFLLDSYCYAVNASVIGGLLREVVSGSRGSGLSVVVDELAPALGNSSISCTYSVTGLVPYYARNVSIPSLLSISEGPMGKLSDVVSLSLSNGGYLEIIVVGNMVLDVSATFLASFAFLVLVLVSSEYSGLRENSKGTERVALGFSVFSMLIVLVLGLEVLATFLYIVPSISAVVLTLFVESSGVVLAGLASILYALSLLNRLFSGFSRAVVAFFVSILILISVFKLLSIAISVSRLMPVSLALSTQGTSLMSWLFPIYFTIVVGLATETYRIREADELARFLVIVSILMLGVSLVGLAMFGNYLMQSIFEKLSEIMSKLNNLLHYIARLG